MPRFPSLSAHAETLGLTLDPDVDPNQLVKSTNKTRVSFTIDACGHPKSLTVATLAKAEAVHCQKCLVGDDYLQNHNLRLDWGDHSITCSEPGCGRKYYRDATKFLYNITQFRCYCQQKRPNEMLFFDALAPVFGEALFRSFSGYGTLKNHSSDFWVKRNDKIFILNLDDKSHRCRANQASDLFKLGLVIDNPDIVNLYIEQAGFLHDPEGTIEWISGVIAGENQRDVRFPNVKVFEHSPLFYHYIVVWLINRAEEEDALEDQDEVEN